MNLQFFTTVYQKSKKEVEQLEKKSGGLSILRLSAALSALVLFALGTYFSLNVVSLLGAAAVILFLIFVRWHSKINEALSYQKALMNAANEYIKRKGTEWKACENTGTKYLSDQFPQAKDLDIFGKNSLYQYLCMAKTPFGQDFLAAWLNRSFTEDKALSERQEAVEELAEKKEFTLTYQALASLSQEKELDSSDDIFDILQQSKNEKKAMPIIVRGFLLICPIATIFFLCTALFGIWKEFSFACFFVLATVQLSLTFLFSSWINKYLEPVNRFHKKVASYRKLVSAIEGENFCCEFLFEIKNRVAKNKGAEAALRELERISEAVAARQNLMAFLLYNSLFLHDFQCINRYIQWKNQWQDQISGWFEAIGEIEACISLGTLCHVKQSFTFPVWKKSKKPWLSTKEIQHPLIEERVAVSNTFETIHRTCIITGSNMSGKTTFLRSIGVNLVLAYAGGAVAAKELTIVPMLLGTSMRIEDNVSEGISTFYAELLRIKNLIDCGKTDMPMIALIDEIYKGTNSKDRIISARETIKRIARPNVITLLTTHDFELCELEENIAIDAANYHFEEHYRENEILFDYKIKKDRCQTTNAQYLLRMVGIIPH